MNFQSDILFIVIFVLTTLINSSGAFGWYDGYRYNLFTKPHISKNKQEDSQALLSLWSKYHFLRRRRSSLDANIFKPNALFMKRFFHFSPLIFMKNKNTKSNKTKLKTLKKHEKHVYRPFNAFGIFINAFRKPLKTETKDSSFTEIVPEIKPVDDFNSQTEENPSLDQSVLDFSNEQSIVVPNLSEIENVPPFRPRPHEPIKSIPTSVVSEGEEVFSDSHLGNVNHFGIETNRDSIGTELLGAGHDSSIPSIDENRDGSSAQLHHGMNTHSKETAKNLNLPQVVLEPIHQRASVSGGFNQLGFSDSDTPNQGVFREFSNEPMDGFDTGFVDGFQGDHGTFHDTIPDSSDVSTDGQITGDIPETFGFSDDGSFLIGDDRLKDHNLLPNTGFEDPFSPYGGIENFYDQEFGGGFENLDNLDSSEIAGGEFFDDGNDFEGFFDTDESGCDGIRTRSCTIDAECSCLGLYFCIEGMCGMRAALPTSDHGFSTDIGGTWLDTPADYR
ncbi:uncharacterized protein [Argopecten irradians]|uniref:uncharacterized protein n=1 Tax=Argopecten irradians TaxID=31199 RepID=UPI0037205BE9